MSNFFKPPTATPPSKPTSWQTPPRTAHKGDRTLTQRLTEAEMTPDHRIPAETLEKKGKVGLTNARVLNREPRGCLFKVSEFGFFDLDGYWVLLKGAKGKNLRRNYEYEVRRGAPRRVNALLSEAQKKELARVRLNARRRGVR